MKRLKIISAIILPLLLALGCSLPVQAQNFEGVIHYKFAGMQKSGMDGIAYMIKGENIRMEFGADNRQGAMLYLSGDSKFVFLMDQMNSYISMDMNKMAKEKSYEGKWSDSEMVKTGETKEIAGHSCEVWQVTNDKGDRLTMCMAEGLGTFMSPGNPMMRSNAPDWARKIANEGQMPLEVIEHTKGGEEQVQMRATRIEEKSLAADLFEIPKGYRDMSGMMQQMMKKRGQ